jgi:hypothetical protein
MPLRRRRPLVSSGALALLQLTTVSSLLFTTRRSSSSSPPPLRRSTVASAASVASTAVASTAARELSAAELAALKADSFVVIPSFCDGATAAALRSDALTLQRLSLCEDAVVTGGGALNRKRICQHSWLHNNAGSTPFEPVLPAAPQKRRGAALRRWLRIPPWAWAAVRGDRRRGRDSRVYLDSLVARLEGQLEGVSQFSDNMAYDEAQARCYALESELAYLFYEAGGLFGQHFDTPGHRMFRDEGGDEGEDEGRYEGQTTGEREEEWEEEEEEEEEEVAHRRSFSFVLYLNEGWDERDGGQLEISPSISAAEQRRRSARNAEPGKGGLWVDDEGATRVLPEAGTLVLFRSEAIPHRVAETRRERQAVVGWLHGSIDAYF